MVISFDLDDLLIPGVKTFPTEKRNWIQKILDVETLRLGAVQLFKELRKQGHSICIYTTSFRPKLKIRLMFISYSIQIDRIINQKLHNDVLKAQRNRASKYPLAFGIDAHVDDSLGVKIEGDRYGFATIIINEEDTNWIETVLDGIRSLGKP